MNDDLLSPPPYSIVENRIHTYTCELNIAHHCNMACRSCGHLSPIAKRHYTPPEEVYEELYILSRHYQTEHVRLLGGEPLLHPQLLEVAKAVLQSGVTNKIRVVTNGILLWKMPDSFWETVHEVHVSVYPGREMTAEQRSLCETKAAAFHVELEFLYFDRFRESYTELGTDDASLVTRIYRTCQMAHRWRCHNVENGYFFKCPQAHMFPAYLPDKGLKPFVDGVRIENVPDLKDRLLHYLEAPSPLQCCRYCLGSVGRLFPHEEIQRRAWRERQQFGTEDLIDWEHLQVLERVDPDEDNLCQRSHLDGVPQ